MDLENSRIRQRSLICNLSVATVIINIILIVLIDDSSVLSVITFSLLFAQISLIALWLALGRTYWLVRVGVLTAIVLAWSIPLDRGKSTAFVTALSVFAITVVSIVVLVRVAGVVWTSETDEPGHEMRDSNKVRQVSLSRLLGWMTVIAVLATVARYADSSALNTETIVVFALTALSILTTAWLASARGKLWLRGASAIVVAIVSGMIIGWAIAPSTPPMILFYIVSGAFVFIWVAALRTVGITIHRVKGPRSTTPYARADEVTAPDQQ